MPSATLSALLLWLTACVVSAEIFRNAGFESPLGPENWSCSGCNGLRDGDDKVEGTYSMLVSERVADWAGPSQVLEWGSAVKDGRSYAFRIFVKLLDGGTTPYQVKATMNMKMKDGSEVHLMMFSTNMTAQDGWRRMYGDITVPDTYGGSVSRVWMHVAGAPAAVRFLVDGASLEELSMRESWRAEADARIEQIRKRDVILRVNTDSPESIEVEVAQTKSHFAFGSAVNATALETSGHYRDFFFNNFEWAVIENGLKWQQTDPYPFVFHSWPDTAIKMLESQGVPIRGHCIFWAKPEHVPKWLGWVDWIWDGVVTHMCRQRVDDVVGRYAER
ncbi:endo-1,4-beta-xylanase 1-like [Branchiostoma floridae]|uniref:Endo-1,4-beta-xylanase 1-like n=1 Tax=Branchiostoma floridae TaxID=7739 RepID=A0A9J7HX55_BRAFL|nr:endo-1,4-beta-xylanase 1-like [Branchiostoma floridae]